MKQNSQKTKKLLVVSIIIGCLLTGNPLTFAAQENQTNTIQEVKNQTTELVTAKDENNPNELAFRIETLKKVIELSVAETKSIKLKLFETEKEEGSVQAWKEKTMEKLKEVSLYYEAQKELISKGEIKTLEATKESAQKFKEWRETNYLPLAEEINNFFLIKEEKNALETARDRWQKISADVEKLKKASIETSKLKDLLKQADVLIEESKKMNETAWQLFEKNILTMPPEEETSTSTKITALEETTTTLNISEEQEASSTTSTITTGEEPILLSPHIAIKTLVKDSFVKIKEVYQVFIEMSNVVRTLLQL